MTMATAAAIRPAVSSCFSLIDGAIIPLIRSCETAADMTSNSPAAVDKAAAIPPERWAHRDHVLMNRDDCAEIGLAEGDPVTLRSDTGEFRGRVKIAPIRPRNLQVHWPEGNVLIQSGRFDRRSGEPDYNAWVQVLPGDRG